MNGAWRIVKTYTIVGAASADEALVETPDIEPESTTIREIGLPEDRHGVQKLYEQPLEILDLAWDDYMDRSLPPDITNSVRLQLPSLADLAMMGRPITPQELSLLFDCAISAYRRHKESGGREQS